MAISFNNLINCTDPLLTFRAYYVLAATPTFTARNTTTSDFYTNTAVAGDYMLYSMAQSIQKIRGVQFVVSTALVAAASTVVWEYYKNDGTWAALAGVTDNTNGFTTLGTNTVTWTVPTDWGSTTTTLNGLAGMFWFRARLSVATTLTEGGAMNGLIKVYDNSVRVDSNHEFDSGTATAGAATSITNTGKAYTVNALMGRFVVIHTGTGAGQWRVVRNNTATVINITDKWDTTPDNTSQYSITANFEDLYLADVAGGWGVVSKIGNRSYAFNCYLNFQACSFGDTAKNIEFPYAYGFYTSVAHTSRYMLLLGWRLPKIYGLDKGILGNSFVFEEFGAADVRYFGYGIQSAYVHTVDNVYRLNMASNLDPVNSVIWFIHQGGTSICEKWEGWRSVTFPKAATEVRSPDVKFGYSGVEQAAAAITGLKSYYNRGLSLFNTLTGTFVMKGFELGLSNVINSINRFSGEPMQWYAAPTSVYNIVDYQGARFRPKGDVYSTSANTSIGENTYMKNTLNVTVVDEQRNPLEGAKVIIKDQPQSNGYKSLDFDMVDDYVSAPNSSAGNQVFGATSFSIEAWMFCQSTGEGTQGRIIDKGGVMTLFNSSGSFAFSILTNTGTRTSNIIVPTNNSWQHIVGVWNGSTMQLYMNNTTGTATAFSGTPNNDSAASLYIGNDSTNSKTFDGQIRMLRMWKNYALTASDVSALWNEGNFSQTATCPVAGTTAEYKFTDGSGSTLTDSSSNANHGTLGATTQAPTWVNTNVSLTNTVITATTGTVGEFLNAQAVTLAGSYSLSSQPTSATKLRFVISDFYDRSALNTLNAVIDIIGTDANGNAIEDYIQLENIGNGIYYTAQEFLTVTASGIITQGFSATMTVDRAGAIYPQTVTNERWQDHDDVVTRHAEYGPFEIKVSRPGFDPVTIKRNIYTPLNLEIPLKKSILEIN